MIIRIFTPEQPAVEKNEPAVEPAAPFFGVVEPVRRRRWAPMLLSLACHGAAFVLIPYVADLLSMIDYQRSSWSSFRVEEMRIRVPQTIYYSPPDPPAKRTPMRKPAPQRDALKQPAPAPPRKQLKTFTGIPAGMEIASTPKFLPEAPVILQPDAQRKDLTKLANSVPLLAYWARQSPSLPRPTRRQLIVPGRNEAPTPAPQMPAPPVIAVPNRETSFGDLNVSMPSGLAPPKLPVQNATTAPVRDSQGAARPGATNSVEGQAANIIAISPNRPRPDEIVTIPRNLQNTPPAGSGASAQAPAGNPPARNSGPDPAQGRDTGAASRPSEAAGKSAGAGRGAADAPHSLDIAAAVKPAAVVPPAQNQGVTRIAHPVNGSFDVVIQSSRDDLPEVKSLLTGSPVYKVYLQVGDKTEWLLEFCAPPADTSHNNPYEVYVGDAAPLSPPYPVSTVIPNSLMGQRRPKAITLHGFLTAAGRFRNIEGRDAGNPVVHDLASLLDQWEFRPAARDKKPTEVEIVLVLPAVSE